MKKVINNLSNLKIIIATFCLMLVILIVGFSYALWNRSFQQTGINTNTYGCFNLEFKENVDGTTLNNAYPQSDEEGLLNDSYDVTITNTCNIVASYNVILNKINTSTLDSSHVKIAVDNEINLLSETESMNSNVLNANEARIVNTGVLAPSKSRTLKIRNWVDEATTIEQGAEKTFTSKITIEAVTGSKLLANIILTNNKISNTAPSLDAIKYGEPTTANLNNTIVKEYKEDYNTALNLPSTRYLGTGYTFDKKTGRYNLTHRIKKSDLTGSPVNYYFCSSASGKNCTIMYKALEYNGSKVTKAIKYTIVRSFNNEKIFMSEDDEGTSYYYRGEVENNYVSFANNLWRIVRINGDTSIRLILNDVSGETISFNNQDDNEKYVGYTYDNESSCTKENPCISTYNKETNTFSNNKNVTNSTIKEYLENTWYQKLKEYDDYIALGSYCNDTTMVKNLPDASQDYYQFYERTYRNYLPILTCPNTEVSYGGYYKSKIGLINSDELVLAGISAYNVTGTLLNHISISQEVWGMTPIHRNFSGHSALVLTASSRLWNNLANDYVTNSYNVRPVINLRSDVKVISGDGSKANPYVIGID